MTTDIREYIKRRIASLLEHRARLKITRLKPGRGYEDDRYRYQKEIVHFNIRAGDQVLDVGSGGHPFPLATHLADLYVGDTSHRAHDIVKDHRPFVVCNIEQMPFFNKQFDFVYCSHVLEHVDDPQKACDEIMRIGKRGYIETPTKTTDILFNFLRLKGHHKWFIECRSNTLIFIEWNNDERIDFGTSYFYEQYHSIWKNPFQDMVANNRKLFMNMMLWESRFEYVVINKFGKVIADSSS